MTRRPHPRDLIDTLANVGLLMFVAVAVFNLFRGW